MKWVTTSWTDSMLWIEQTFYRLARSAWPTRCSVDGESGYGGLHPRFDVIITLFIRGPLFFFCWKGCDKTYLVMSPWFSVEKYWKLLMLSKMMYRIFFCNKKIFFCIQYVQEKRDVAAFLLENDKLPNFFAGIDGVFMRFDGKPRNGLDKHVFT